MRAIFPKRSPLHGALDHGVIARICAAGLYAGRMGAVNYVLADAAAAKRVLSQSKPNAKP